MDLLIGLTEISYGAVLVATIVSFVIWSVWYSPGVFGRQRMEKEGLSEEDLSRGSMRLMMAGSFVASFLIGMVMALLFGGTGLTTGITFGLLLGVGLIAANRATHHLFAQKSRRHYLIVTVPDLLTFAAMGALIGAW